MIMLVKIHQELTDEEGGGVTFYNVEAAAAFTLLVSLVPQLALFKTAHYLNSGTNPQRWPRFKAATWEDDFYNHRNEIPGYAYEYYGAWVRRISLSLYEQEGDIRAQLLSGQRLGSRVLLPLAVEWDPNRFSFLLRLSNLSTRRKLTRREWYWLVPFWIRPFLARDPPPRQ